ncbi:MAG: hypothetical protein O3A46_16295 [Candidatus Poribacteria bacterium]|nr:hypothetical protein [Candidatus Poribacteria bacterium]
MDLFFAFGYNAFMERIGKREILHYPTSDEVREIVEDGVLLWFDGTCRHLLKALRKEFDIRVPYTGRNGQRPKPGDELLIAWIECPRPADPADYDEEELQDACYFFTVEQIV